jgi:hypothetical protein
MWPKLKRKCLNCGKKGHRAKDCWRPKKGKSHVSLFLASVGDFVPNTSAPEQGSNGKNSNGGATAPSKDLQPIAIGEYLGLGVDEATD